MKYPKAHVLNNLGNKHTWESDGGGNPLTHKKVLLIFTGFPTLPRSCFSEMNIDVWNSFCQG